MAHDWKLTGTSPDCTVQLSVALPEAVGGIRDLDVSVEGGQDGRDPTLVIALAGDGAILMRKPFPGLGEDADSLRASFSKRTRQLKLTMPILVGRSECHSSADEPAMDQLSAGGSATGSTPSMRMEGQNDRQPGKGLGFAAQNPASAVDPCITDDTYTAEDVRRRMAAMLSEASRSLPDTAIRVTLRDFPVKYNCTNDASDGGCRTGRHLTAAKALEPGTVVLQDAPLVAAVSDRYLGARCCCCFKPILTNQDDGRGFPCSDCGAVTYCSAECREADKAFHSGAECSFLQMYLKKNPGAAVGGMRLVLRLLYALRSSGGMGGWEIFDTLQEMPPPPVVSEPPSAFEEFIVERSRAFQTETASKARNLAGMMRSVGISEQEITSVLSKLQANLVGICDSDGGNLGSGLYSRAWLFNHSCRPNVVISFKGTRLEARTMTRVEEGEVLTIGYTEVYETAEVRQRNLFASKGFRCQCPRCEAFTPPGVGDGCIAAWKDPRRAGSFMYHPAEVCAMTPPGETRVQENGPDDGTVKVMTEQNEVWRERLTRGLAYLSRAREVPDSDPRHNSALEQAQEVLEKVLHESSGNLHPHHAIRLAAMQGAADAARELGRADACLAHVQGAVECMREHCCENHPGLARLLRLQGEMTMKQGIQQMRQSKMQAKLMLSGAVRQLQAATKILETAYGPDHPDIAHALKPLETANGLLQRLKAPVA